MGTVKRYSTPGGLLGYEARDSWTDPATGQRLHKKQRFPAAKFGGLKKAEAQANAWLAQREADRSRGVIWEPSRETIGSLLDRWAEQLGPPLSDNTVINYRTAIRRRFAKDVRAWRVGDLTPAHGRRLLARWEQEGLSHETVSLAWKALRSALLMARDEGGIHVNPFDGIKRRRTTSKTINTWSPDQVRQFLTSRAEDPFVYAWELLFATCCRIGELCAFRWSDIEPIRDEHGDEVGQVIVVRRTWTGNSGHGSSRKIVERTKTGQVRRIPLPVDVSARLQQVKASRPPGDEWIVAGTVSPIHPNTLRPYWDHAVAESGLPRLVPHEARHTGATNLIAAGVPPTVVQRILGHADIGMTLRLYVHPGEQDAASAIEVLSGLYRGETTLSRAQSAPKVVPITKKLG